MTRTITTISAIVALALSSTSLAQNTYNVNEASTAPTIDGVVSAGEWADADPAAGGWRILRDASGAADAHNNRFQLSWDANNLYLLAESDYGGWLTSLSDDADFGADNLNLYFDPNRDGEAAMGGPMMNFDEVDGYQIVVNQFDGSFACTACSTEIDADPFNPLGSGEAGTGLGTFAEAHVDTLFGNQAGWEGMRGTQIATQFGATGGAVEMAIPWSDFDAPGVAADGTVLDTGLDLGGVAPTNGETWFFNAATISSDGGNFLPVWNWHTNPNGTEFFASHPHGEITFVSSSSASGDFDGDGNYTCADIDLLVNEAVNGGTTTDLNGDGVVDTTDRDLWLAEAGTALGFASPIGLGDYDISGAVDVSDFNIWNSNKFSSTAAWCQGDGNLDGVTDVTDFNLWNANKFTTSDMQHSVPEPSSMLTMLVGLAALGMLRRRK